MTTPFAERLRARVQELGLSQNEAARRAGLPERRFGHYVKRRLDTGLPGEPDFEDLLKICKALDTHPNYLLGISNNPEFLESNHGQVRRRIKRLGRILDRLASGL